MKLSRIHPILLPAALVALSFATVADAKIVKRGESQVVFRATGPAGMKFEGRTSDLSFNDGGNVVVVVALGNLSTGIGVRDRHMKEKYLEVQKYPNAELPVARSSLQLPKAGETSGDATGSLTLHGQTKNVPFHYVARPDGETWKVNGSMRVDMKQFGIEVPSYLGVTVRKDVDVTVRFETKDE